MFGLLCYLVGKNMNNDGGKQQLCYFLSMFP